MAEDNSAMSGGISARMNESSPSASPPKTRCSVGIGMVIRLDNGSSVLVDEMTVEMAEEVSCQMFGRVRRTRGLTRNRATLWRPSHR
jgi:hypothetical protein